MLPPNGVPLTRLVMQDLTDVLVRLVISTILATPTNAMLQAGHNGHSRSPCQSIWRSGISAMPKDANGDTHCGSHHRAIAALGIMCAVSLTCSAMAACCTAQTADAVVIANAGGWLCQSC